MERAISSLAFNGSIAEAVVEAKRQKKLFVVYISGDNPESIHLEEFAWTDQRVTESLSKYCILLHILEGSTDATQFSAIYPQKSVPCIAAIGYNGVQLWQSEGFVSAEVLASSLEKAWLSLHIQETTATFLTAALASGKAEQPASGASDTTTFEQGSSSRSDVKAPSKDDAHSSETTKLANTEIVEENKHCDHAVENINSKPADVVSPASVLVNELESSVAEQAVPSTATVKEPLNPVEIELNNTGVGNKSSSAEDIFPAPEVVYQHSRVNVEASGVIHNEGSKPVVDKKAETVETEKTDILEFSRSKSNDVHLNIRLPNSSSLQRKFSVMSTLRMVKDYVDENQESSVGPYDLAIPYPRKVFTNQDLSKTLSELDLFNRQALIVVPHHRASGHDKAGISSRNQTTSNNDVDSSSGSSEGYFAFVKRMVSYVNPFSYLGGGGASSSSGPVQEPQSNMWQYSPNPTLQNNPRGTGRPQTAASATTSTSTSGAANNSVRRRQTVPFGSGSNIHTLKRDEDEDDRFTGKNAFWNGNSTQYGGDNNDAK
ncbi:hypothetical protein LguiB_027454 [Lonicera macranthoides]